MQTRPQSFIKKIWRNVSDAFTIDSGSNIHDGAGQARRAKYWQTSASGPRFEHSGFYTLRNRSRDLWRNNPIARGIVNMLVADTIVGGIKPILPKEIRRPVIDIFNDWAQTASPFAPTDLYAIQSQALRSLIIDGEVLIHIFNDNENGGQLALRLIEADCLASTAVSSRKSNIITDGVETDIYGRKQFYHLYTNHPGDGQNYEIIEVPAKDILHIYRADRPGQLRGVPWLTPAMQRLKLIDDLDDAQLERQRIANLFAGFIVKPEGFTPPVQAENTTPAPISLEPGIMQELLDGEDVRFNSPPGAMDNYQDYLLTEISLVCASLGAPYQLVTGQFGSANDRVIRVLLTRYARQIDQICTQILIPQLCQPIYNKWVKWAKLAGVITSPLSAVSKPTFPVPAWEYIHPVQDVVAQGKAMELGLVARRDLIIQRGGDPAHIDAEILADEIQKGIIAAGMNADPQSEDDLADKTPLTDIKTKG